MTLAIMVIAGLTSCNDDENEGSPNPIAVEFGEDQTLSENIGVTTVSISFEQPAHTAGTIEVKVTTDQQNTFTTTPAAVDGMISIVVDKGDESASFTIIPTNNTVLDGNKSVLFEIEDLTEGFSKGVKNQLEITILDDEAPSSVFFPGETIEVKENVSGGVEVTLGFSAPAPGAGQVVIKLGDSYEPGYFTTDPEIQNGKITLNVEQGALEVKFRINTINNEVINGNKQVLFQISEVQGAIEKGTALDFLVNVIDDELIGKPKSYHNVGGNWSDKRTFEYDEIGRIKKIFWETATPFTRSGVYTYYYGENGLIEKINSYPNHDEFFIQEDGKIVRSEIIDYGIKKSYSIYDYDEAGNLGGQAIYYRQSDSNYMLGLVFVYLNDLEGNIYKQLNYNPINGSEEDLSLISTITYSSYYNKTNPFPMFEVIPTIISQSKLPGSYQFEGDGSNLYYNLSYEFNDQGMPTKRFVSGAGTEQTTYEYY
ncbi:MAG: hypothetical protein RIA62_18340 [Cyclobacteriaceae bacterium]